MRTGGVSNPDILMEETYRKLLIDNGLAVWHFLRYPSCVALFPGRLKQIKICHVRKIIAMFQHYLTIAFRNLWRKRGFSLLNISGLAVGIAASLLIFLVIHYETGYDGWQSKKDRIYRVTTVSSKHSNGEATAYESAIPLPLPEALRHDLPQLEKLSAMWNIGGAQIHVPGPRGLEDEKMFKENEGLFFAEPSLFEFFDYKWLAGNAVGLKDPHTVVLTKSLADTYFGNPQNAIGKMIQLWSFRVPLRVTGVFQDLPAKEDSPISGDPPFHRGRR